jgi:FMN phosphatase YigB (HAD superfamily)
MKAVIFDLGNVLIPYDHHRTVAAVAALCGCDDKRITAIFHTLAEPFGSGRMEPAAFSREVLRQAGAPPHITEAAFSAAFNTGMGRDAQALAYAVALQGRPNVTVGVISNTNAVHVAWLDEHAPELAELDLVMMSNEVELLKPDPEIFLLALSLLEVAPADACFVDDQPANVDAAAALGIYALLHRAWDETLPAIEAWLAG